MKSPKSLYHTLFYLAFAMILALPSALTAQDRSNDAPRVSPNASVSQTIGTTVVTVTYGRPSVKGRDIYGGLVPFDAVWRAGANESTVITFSEDVTVAGGSGEAQALEAGSYSLFAIPGEEIWSVMFNSDASQWGSYSYNESDNVATVETAAEKTASMEQLMYYFEGVSETEGTLWLHWSDLRVPVVIGSAAAQDSEEE